MKQPPNNLQFVMHTGDFSICEVMRRLIKKFPNGRFPTGEYSIIRQERDEQHQLPEKTFENMFQFAAGEAIKNPDFQYHYFRMDRSKEVPENQNNEPYYMSKGGIKHFQIYGMDFYQDMSGYRGRTLPPEI